MKGRAVSKAARKKADVVVVAARYEPRDGRLLLAQAYERRGPIWGDVVLLDRQALLERIQQGKRVYAGAPADLEGDFRLFHRISASRLNGRLVLHAEGKDKEGDDLGVPLF